MMNFLIFKIDVSGYIKKSMAICLSIRFSLYVFRSQYDRVDGFKGPHIINLQVSYPKLHLSNFISRIDYQPVQIREVE